MTKGEVMSYEIEKGVPVPKNAAGYSRLGRRKYPFAQMEIGDSFAFSDNTKQNTAGAAVFRENKRSDFKFVTRKVDGVIRCWRVA